MLTRGIGIALCCALAWIASSATAVTYQYTGNPFTETAGPYTTADFVSGTIELSSVLPSNMSLGPITVNAYSFSDGVNTLTQTNSSLAQSSVSTNGNGVITDWSVEMLAPSGSQISTNNGSSLTADDGLLPGIPPAGFGQNSNNAGVWTLVPEPSTALLFATGVVGLAARRHRARGASIG